MLEHTLAAIPVFDLAPEELRQAERLVRRICYEDSEEVLAILGLA